MFSIEFNRDDLFPWCKKISFNLIALNEHIDLERLKREGKLYNHDYYKADIVFFTDDDGSKKVLRSKK
jgi:hypothetical protein